MIPSFQNSVNDIVTHIETEKILLMTLQLTLNSTVSAIKYLERIVGGGFELSCQSYTITER